MAIPTCSGWSKCCCALGHLFTLHFYCTGRRLNVGLCGEDMALESGSREQVASKETISHTSPAETRLGGRIHTVWFFSFDGRSYSFCEEHFIVSSIHTTTALWAISSKNISFHRFLIGFRNDPGLSHPKLSLKGDLFQQSLQDLAFFSSAPSSWQPYGKDWVSPAHCWAGRGFSHKHFLISYYSGISFLVHFVRNCILSGRSSRPTRKRHAGRDFLVMASLSAAHLGTGNPPRSLGKEMPRSYHNQHLHLGFKRLVQSLLRTVKDFPLIVTRSKPCKKRHPVWTVVTLVMMNWRN